MTTRMPPRGRPKLDRTRQVVGTSRQQGFVRAGAWRSFGAFLATYPEVSLADLTADAGIDPADLGNRDRLVGLRSIVSMLEAAAAATKDPAFSVRLGMQLPWGDIGVLAYVAFNSATFGAALTNIARYFAVQQTASGTSLEVRGPTARVAYTIDDPTVGAHGQETQLILYLLARVDHDALDQWAPREVHLHQRAPERAARDVISRAFRCPVSWGAAMDALVFEAADLRRPMRGADPQLLPILIAHAEAILPRTDDFIGSVRRLVIAGISGGDASADAIAARLGLAPRSLQRRLAAEGVSFTEIVDEARLALAHRYLDDRALSLTEAAFLLGYSDLSAFSRAFRRWTGSSPVAYRRLHAA